MPAKVDGVIARCPWLVPVGADAEKDRDAWVAARAAGLGGSEIAAVVGEHPDKSPIDVFLDKTGMPQPFDSDRTFVGRELEPIVIGWYGRGEPYWPRPGGEYTIGKPPTCYHRDRPWQRGSPDGLAYLPEQVVCAVPAGDDSLLSSLVPDHMVEVKTHGWFAGRNYERTDDGVPVAVPNDKRIQCEWYMELFNVERCHLVALVDTHMRRTYVVHRDREVGAYLLEEGERFWTQHVLPGIPPSPDGTESFSRYLSQRFKTHRPDLLIASPEINDAARKLLRTKRAEKRLERLRDLLEQQIKLFIGDAAGVKTAHGAITWKSQRSGKHKTEELLTELRNRAGLTDDELATIKKTYELPDHRVMRTPK